MLRKMCLAFTLMAMLAVILVPHNSATAAPDMQTITLNTGYNHDTQSVYSTGAVDAFWTLIQDPVVGTAEPRSANVINKHAAWAAAQPSSQWISYAANGSTGIKQGPYVYQKCFCLTKALWSNEAAIQQSSLDVSVTADDNFYVGLNQIPTPGSNLLTQGGGKGGFTGPPAVLKLSGDKLKSLLRPGKNCLIVRVDDLGGVITGFNLAGSLTTTGIDGIAKGAKGEFNSCSSCRNTRDVGPAVLDGPIRLSN